MILVLYRSDPALPELEQKLTQGSRVCKMFQKTMKLPNMLVAIGGCDRPLAADRSVPLRTRHHDKSFLSVLLACMHELLLDMVHSG